MARGPLRMVARGAGRVAERLGVDVVRHREFPPDFTPFEMDIIRAVRGHTMTSAERLFALIQAVRYVVAAGIPGAIVECGVWKGGSMMAVAHTLRRLGVADRELYLFDTFEGMTDPGTEDVSYTGRPAAADFSEDWLAVSVEAVREAVTSVGYPADRLHFVKGDVEQTIPGAAPESVALLRLDTDWYASTHHELVHLYPRLASAGVLIIDDYGHWRGARQAVDEYVAETELRLLLNRIDYSGRIAVKP
ncbi:MAG: TylF/MycF family methyltransferase [Chloroflexota bacterium]|nr:TylF/MycF family methyltransferase [Chloroflexota bacterium]